MKKEKSRKERKVSPKKKARYDWKWAKVLGWEIERLEKRIEKLEKDIEEIKETVKLIRERLKI